MAAAKSSRVNRKYKTKYRVRNWKEYECGLRNRDDVAIWLSQEAVSAWTPAKNGLRGGQRRYSNLALLTALVSRRPTPWRRERRATQAAKLTPELNRATTPPEEPSSEKARPAISCRIL